MKKICYLLETIIVMVVIASCQDDKDSTPPGTVTDVDATAGYGEVILKWNNPADENFYYVNIAFVDSKGEQRSSKVSRFASSDTITGFTDTNPYTFTLVAYNYSDGASSPVTISVAPLEPAFVSVINTVGMISDFGGAIVFWENETGKPLTVRVSYKDDSGEKVTSLFDASESGKGYISELSASLRTFDVTVSDDSDNSSDVRSFEITPLEEEKIDKLQWSVVDFSSQEPAEGAPNGYVTAVFDGDVSTFWHTAWSSSQPGYPHWFSIDLGQEVTISRFVCYRRQDDDRGQTVCQFLTSLDGETWTDQGTYDFDPESNDGQSYRMTSNPIARYFKYVAAEGSDYYAFLGEITIYGSTSAVQTGKSSYGIKSGT